MANAAFYTAFTHGDLEGMDEVWARHCQVTCIHPGWAPLVGREEVMESWRAILEQPHRPHIACQDPIVIAHGSFALVVCREEVSGVELSATNLFVQEDGGWKMVHHQAGPIAGGGAAPQEPLLH